MTSMALVERQAAVIGGGVIGFTCGLELQAAGYDVSIVAKDFTPHTTSDVAAAFWYPFHVYPPGPAAVWGKYTFNEFVQLANIPGAGVSMAPAKIFFEEPTADPLWASYVPDFEQAWPEDLPDGYCAAYLFTTPVIEMPRYMHFLMRRFLRAGGEIVQRELRSLDEALNRAAVVVNCTGLGARTLVGDSRVHPIRGQVVRVRRPAVPPAVLLAEGPRFGLGYVVHRSMDSIVGGTTEYGNESLIPDPATTETIMARAARLAPEIAGAEILQELVGLRPGRDSVRLDAEHREDGRIVASCYGHGGGGVSLSWGCAAALVDLLPRQERRQEAA